MRKLMGITVFLLFAVATQAAQVTKTIGVSWEYPAAEEANLVGFRVYNQFGTILADKIAPNLRKASFVYTYDDAAIQAMHMIAIAKDGRVTSPSNIFLLPGTPAAITAVGKVTIEIQPPAPVPPAP